MKCPHCGFDKILPMYRVCPKCKQPLSDSSTSKSIKSEDVPQEQPVSPQEKVKSDIGSVGTLNNTLNYITWTIAPGQIARNISAQEVSSIADVDGVYVQEGVTAVIFVDGLQVAELSGGLYKFASDKVRAEAAMKYAQDEEDRRAHEGILRKIGRMGQSLLHLVFGQSERVRREEQQKRRDAIKELAKKISGDSIVAVVLKRDGVVNFPMGIRPIVAEDGDNTITFAPYKIRTQSLTLDVAVTMEARIYDFFEFRTNYLMDRNSFTVNDLRVALNSFMRTTLQRSLQYYAADGDLLPQELMSSISYELMTKSRELLHGIAVSNVLDITTDNAAFERFREIEEKLFCTDKEIDYLSRTNEFKNRLQSVENQQKVAEAKSELDLRKELDVINKDQLIHEDEMNAFVELLQSQKRIREATTENEELAALLKLKGNKLVNEDELDALESSIRDKKFDRDQVSATFQLNAAHRTEMMRVQLDRELQKNQLLADAELKDIRFEQVRKDLEHDIQLSEMQEAHADSRREKDFDFEQRQKDAEYARSQREKLDEIDLLNRKAEIARKNLEAMQAHEKEMADITHEEEMAKIAAQQNMSAEQMMAFNATGLSAEAQKAFADALASGKGTEREREMYERMLQMQSEMGSSNQTQQAALMQQMMAMMQGAMQTNATMAANMAAGQAAQSKAMKEEHRKELEAQQKRTDTAQDKALNYTTKVTQEEIKATAKLGKEVKDKKQPFFIPDFGASYTLKEMGSLILNGTIGPETEVEYDGESLTVAEIDELLPFLEKKYGEA